MERTLLVTVKSDRDKDAFSPKDQEQELMELAKTAGAHVEDYIICSRDKLTSGLYIGRGKAQEIALLCQENSIDTIIFNNDLSGTQQRNLEEIINRKTIDRTQLILDIFVRHAHSPEASLQVELAQLEYLLPRLTGKGIFLSRLGGGIGTRGPGETKLEVDRRRIRRRITKISHDLETVRMRRQALRKQRKESCIASVSLVGYTNAGKTSLLNTLTQENQSVRESLFTTLDTLSRSFKLPNHQKIVTSDTVGFLQNLPHHLIEAFKATLDEVKEADLLIHVLDVSHPLAYERSKAVLKVLKELGADQKPTITALNKIDKLADRDWLVRYHHDFPNAVTISAKTRENLDELLDKIEEELRDSFLAVELTIPIEKMALVDLIYREGQVKSIEYSEKGVKIEAVLPALTISKLSAYIKS
ncbi:MAG: GTPase HflX [Candidatus Omnitrophota bacterium]